MARSLVFTEADRETHTPGLNETIKICTFIQIGLLSPRCPTGGS
jgi:hypothetical protein